MELGEEQEYLSRIFKMKKFNFSLQIQFFVKI